MLGRVLQGTLSQSEAISACLAMLCIYLFYLSGKPVESNCQVMANRKSDRKDRERIEPSVALNAICPYYTMFPLAFPITVLKRFGGAKLRVVDPFCGRGITIFAARIKGHQAYGIDCSPIAIAIARAKLAETTN